MKSTGFCLTVVLATLVVTFVMFGQQSQAPQQPSSPPSGTPSGPTSPGATPSPMPTPTPRDRSPFPQQQDRQQQDRLPFPDMARPIFLSGKVVLEDGTPPPESVIIERICNGIARPEAYTDSKGRFSFQLGQNSSVMADASVSSASDGLGRSTDLSRQQSTGMAGRSSGISERDLMGCEIRASLAGYRSEIVNLAGRRSMDNPDVGTIILKRLANVEGLTISATTALAPKDARKAFDKGRDAVKKNKWPEARKEFEKAVSLYPKFATAWYQLGMVQEKQNEGEAAQKSYEEALKADSKFVSPYLQMAQIAARQNKWQDVADTTDRVIKLNPFDFPVAYFYNSVAHLNLRNIDAAEKSAREAAKLDPNHRIPKVNHVLGVILAQKQEYPEAAEQMRSYLKFAPNASDADHVRKQLAEVEKFAGTPKPAQAEPRQ